MGHALGHLLEEHPRISLASSLLEHSQSFFQFLNLISILSKKSILGVFIDLGFVLNLLSSGSVSERTESFVIVVVCRGKSSDHDCFGVSS